MTTLQWIYLAILILLLALCFCYNACDMAYSAANKLRLEREAHRGSKRAKRALGFAEDYDRTIATILFGNDFVNVFASSLAVVLGAAILEGVVEDRFISLISSTVLIAAILIFGEILPKAIAMRNPNRFAKLFVGFMRVSSIILFPFVFPVNWLSKKIASPLIEKAGPQSELASDEELEAMVDEIREEGIIDDDDQELLHNSIDFKETSCFEIMTPRVKIFAYDLEDSFEEFLKQKNAFVHSRIPVCRGDLDHIEGYLQAKTLLRVLVSGQKPDLKELILPIVSVPRTMEISSALSLMKKTKSHIALVRDEFGGTEGIVTLEDILEELVGDMWDEEDKITDDITPISGKKNAYMVRGEMNVDDFFERFGLDEDRIEDDYSTVSGWINDKLGRFAKVGDRLIYDKIDLVVHEVRDYHVTKLVVYHHSRRRNKRDKIIPAE